MSNNTLTYFIRDITDRPLLTFEQEQRFGKSIRAGIDAAKRLAGGSTILPEERAGLEVLVKRGKQARDDLIGGNFRLVISVASKFQGRGIPFEDLIQEGNLGMMKAAEKFETERGLRFSTYATWWIRQMITRAVADQGRTIRLPVHKHDRLNQCVAVQGRLHKEKGRLPSLSEIAKEMNGGITTAEVTELLLLKKPMLSLNVPLDGEEFDGDGGELIQRLIEQSAIDPHDAAARSDLKSKLEALILTELDAREARIVRLRFGFNGEGPMVLQEVAARFGLTRERIRQIEVVAIKKLRAAYIRKIG